MSRVISPVVRKKSVMARKKRKLTKAERQAKKKRQAEYEWIFVNGRQKRIKRSPQGDLTEAEIEAFYREFPHLALEDGYEWVIGLQMLEEDEMAYYGETIYDHDDEALPF